VVDTVLPRWDDFDPPVVDALVHKIELDMSRFPRLNRFVVLLLFVVVQWSGLWLLDGLRPFTALSRADRERRFRRIYESRRPLVRNFAKVLIALVTVNYYNLPEVEQYIGVDRTAWRNNRIALRKRLLAQHPAGPDAPPVPAPLGSERVVTRDTYLSDEPNREVTP
jgi:hypothetical protein